MCKSFLPTVRELVEREPGHFASCYTFKQRRNTVLDCQRRIAVWREAFPDSVRPNQLARFLLAKDATGARLNRLIPAWAKTPPPKRKEFVPGLPPQFPGWVTQQNKESLSFFNRQWR